MKLQSLYNDGDSLKEIHAYLISYLTEEAVKRLFEDEGEVYAIGEAKRIIDKAFENLDLLFGSKPKQKKEKLNPAR